MTTAGACKCVGRAGVGQGTSPDTGAAAGANNAGRGREGLGRRCEEEERKEQQQERPHWLQHGGKAGRHDGLAEKSREKDVKAPRQELFPDD